MNYLGFDIGGTKSAVLLADENGKTFVREVFPTAAPTETLERLFEFGEKFGGDPVAAGVSCGGPLNETTGVILSPPNLAGWDEIPVKEMIESRFGIPAKLCNDANACALAEWRFGAGKGTQNMIFLTFGTGLGAGLILNGRLYSGTNGNAGEAGHIRLSAFGPVGYGKGGSFEGFCSGSGIAQQGKTAALELIQQGKAPAYCKSLAELESVTAKTIAVAADAGDETAKAVYRQCGTMLGRGLSVLIDILNPECIVIGSVFARSEHLLREAMQTEIDREALGISAACCRVVPAGLGEQIGDYAAIAAAMVALEEKGE